MQRLEGYALFRKAVAHIDATKGVRQWPTWEEACLVAIYEHYELCGAPPTWVSGWARVARYVLGEIPQHKIFKPHRKRCGCKACGHYGGYTIDGADGDHVTFEW
jgi:hypothetical protein